ncbi:MAG: hypothetical protein ACREAB_15315 [Blastocatellia bacterium]
MKIILYLVIGLILSGGGVLLLQNAGVIRQPTAEERQRIKFEGQAREHYRAHIASAKAGGASDIRIVSVGLRTNVTALEQITNIYSLARVKVKDKEVSVNPAGNIQTWYKVDLLGFEHKQDKIGQETLPEHVPIRFLPLLPSESLFFVDGGEITVDGIRIKKEIAGENKIELDLQAEYLIAAHLDCEGKLLRKVTSAEGFFHVQGETLKPFGQRDNGLVREIDRKYGNDLARIRSAIQSRQMQEK